jgi:phosphoribosyl 1,2-cyclic phosphodiesterase
MKLTMLGSGGGRFVMLEQVRGTGGFVLEIGGKLLFFDPGPGALINAKKYKLKLRKLDGILVSHSHIDHTNDLNLVIEAMTWGAKKKRGFLAADSVTLNGGKGEPARINDYYKAPLEGIFLMKAGDTKEIDGLMITATKSTHDERKPEMGFVKNNIPTHGYLIEAGGERFGYTSDGEYYPGMEKNFQGCDLLVLNCTRPSDNPWPGQMDAKQAKEFIGKARPGTAVLSHLGMKMVFGRAEREAAEIRKETGIRTLAARDGMVIDTGTQKSFTKTFSRKSPQKQAPNSNRNSKISSYLS